MQTRSKTQNIVEVTIDFDDASKEWRKNKKAIGNSQYKYICQIQTNKKSVCGKVCYNNSNNCWMHRNF